MSNLVRVGLEATTAAHKVTRENMMAQRKIAIKSQDDRKTRLADSKARRTAMRAIIAAKSTLVQDNGTHAWVLFEGSEAQSRLRKLYKEVLEGNEARHGAIEGRVPIRKSGKDWDRRVRRKVMDDIIVPAVAGDLDRPLLDSMYDRAKSRWHAAFTDSSWDANESGNYELLEKTGDTTVKLALQFYLIQARPDISEHELTVAVNTVLAKQEQARASRALDLRSLIRSIYTEPNTDEEEDVFESFYGALYEMGETENMGQQLVNLVFYWMVQEGILDVQGRTFDTPPKTQISTLFASLGWGIPIESTKREGEAWVTQLYMDDVIRRTAANREVRILDIYDAKNRMLRGTPYPVVNPGSISEIVKTGLIASGRGANEALSKYNAYQAAVDKFKSINLIREVSFLEHLNLSQSYDPYYEKEFFSALRRAIAEGYDNIFVTDSKIRYDSKSAYVNLIGIRGNERSVIYSITIPDTRSAAERKKEPPLPKREVRRIIYEKYAETKPSELFEQRDEQEDDIFGIEREDESEEEEEFDEEEE